MNTRRQRGKHAFLTGQGLCIALAITCASVQAAPASQPKVDRILVEKGKRQLGLYAGNKLIESYLIALGTQPIGKKQFEGDGRTPEGEYRIDARLPHSRYHLALHISYPNAEDLRFAQQQHRLPGGQVMIHGQRNGLGWASSLAQRMDWTKGCIALSNKDMDRVWQLVEVNTRVEIVP